jgi:hypothetical protein
VSRTAASHDPHTGAFNQGGGGAWICLCGNVPCDDGFYTCDAKGNEVEPTAMDWTIGLYVCAACGRMIEPRSFGWSDETRPRQCSPNLVLSTDTPHHAACWSCLIGVASAR